MHLQWAASIVSRCRYSVVRDGVRTSCRQRAVRVRTRLCEPPPAFLVQYQLPPPRSFGSVDRTAGAPVATLRIGGED